MTAQTIEKEILGGNDGTARDATPYRNRQAIVIVAFLCVW